MTEETPQYLKELPLPTPFQPAKEIITGFVHHLSQTEKIEGLALATIITGLDYPMLSIDILACIEQNQDRAVRLAAVMETAVEVAEQLERFVIASTMGVVDLPTLGDNPWNQSLVQRYQKNDRIAEVILINFSAKQASHYDFPRSSSPSLCSYCVKQDLSF